MNTEKLTDRLDVILGCLIGSHTSHETAEHQLENLITELRATNNDALGDVRKRNLPPWVRPTIVIIGMFAIIAIAFNVC
ncbi:unnamed protein product [marine sediment metagenome]|uniref:Uncharacterized protein n=1 Tax=marine sediment metagenome TaxID=412755 RepID=X0U9U7_9ZZZZ